MPSRSPAGLKRRPATRRAAAPGDGPDARAAAKLGAAVRRLGPWFHNLHLPGGVQTAPGHWLGDFPSFKWAQIANRVPASLRGWRALDIGCNAGFYSFELARRGARVLGIDAEPHYLRQARWAATLLNLESRVAFRRMQVYELARERDRFDLVLFMGVFYHLRHPLLALETVRRCVRKLLVFQTLTLADSTAEKVPPDVTLEQRELLDRPGWPRMAFVERRMQDDPTNWWVPNAAGVEAMLRSCGFDVLERPGHEIWICRPAASSSQVPRQDAAQYRAAVGLTSRQPA